eukprot:GHVQ01031868.1.p1 GENE.GHVQ01031868.1~~GHVQ01031868.1.p1  ORF type:complete len:336 (-),score=46.99 GHVQ01031868.1:1443-2450(-)
MRKLIEMKVYQPPKWMDAVERAPPLELQSLHLQQRKVFNPYPSMVRRILHKYPHLRFQDCYVDGNDWSKGNDRYRDDHPVMQFATKQLEKIHQGMSSHQAFRETEKEFYSRRMELEKQQKLMMAVAVDENVEPIFTTGHAYWQAHIAEEEARHLVRIRNVLRHLRRRKLASAQTSSDSVADLPPIFAPIRHWSRRKVIRDAFEETEDDVNAPNDYSLSSPAPFIQESLPTVLSDRPSSDRNIVSVPLDPAHMKRKAVVFDPLYAGRHGLFLDEATVGQQPPSGAAAAIAKSPQSPCDASGKSQEEQHEEQGQIHLEPSDYKDEFELVGWKGDEEE